MTVTHDNSNLSSTASDVARRRVAAALMDEGIYLNPVKYPAVPKHRSRFRMSISAAHSREELEEGVRIITSVLQRYGICPTAQGTITSTTG